MDGARRALEASKKFVPWIQRVAFGPEHHGFGANMLDPRARGEVRWWSGRPRAAYAVALVSTQLPLLCVWTRRAVSPASRPGSIFPIVEATALCAVSSTIAFLWLDQEFSRLEKLACRDALTGFLSRGAGEERLSGDLARVGRGYGALALALVDADGLKVVNDAYGHAAGDDYLKRLAGVLLRNLREGDWVARWGGDEFVLGLWDTADPETATKVLERVARELREMAVPSPHFSGANAEAPVSPHPTFSAGVVVCEPGDEPERCLERADALLYEAKRRGRSVIVHGGGPHELPRRGGR